MIRKSITCMSIILLVGCGEESKMEDAINDGLSREPACIYLDENDVIKDSYKTGNILRALNSQGMIELKEERAFFGKVIKLYLTDSGVNNSIMNSEKSICIGKFTVDKINDWSDVGNGYIQVDFSTKLVDKPKWIDKKYISEENIESTSRSATLRKTNKGFSFSG